MLGNRISQLRSQMGWTQSQLAKQISVCSKTIMNWENDTSDPSAVNIIALARIFAISSDILLGIGSSSFINLDSLATRDQMLLRRIIQLFLV